MQTTNQISLSHLYPGVLYTIYVSVVALPEYNNRTYPCAARVSGPFQFQTVESAPAAAPSDLALAHEAGSDVITFSAPHASAWGSLDVNYVLSYTRLPGQARANSTAPATGSIELFGSAINTTGAISAAIGLPERGIAYSMTVHAVNGQGAGPVSAELVAASAEAVPSQPPTNITIARVSSAIVVTWTVPEADSLHGELTGYMMWVQTLYKSSTSLDTCQGATAMQYNISAAATSYVLSQPLDLGYTACVAAVNSAGTGPCSACSVVEPIAASSSTSTGAVAGGVVGGLVLILGVALVLLILSRRSRARVRRLQQFVEEAPTGSESLDHMLGLHLCLLVSLS